MDGPWPTASHDADPLHAEADADPLHAEADADPLHAEADAAGLLLVPPKRKRNGRQTGFGRRRRRPGRRRSRGLPTGPTGPTGSATEAFGAALRSARPGVERFFGTLKAWSDSSARSRRRTSA